MRGPSVTGLADRDRLGRRDIADSL
jgi:hypothetical protein